MSTTKPIRIEVCVETKWVGVKETNIYEIDREQWEAMTVSDRTLLLEEYAQTLLENTVGASARVLDDDES